MMADLMQSDADRRRSGFSTTRRRAAPTPARLAMRRFTIGLTKRLLPLGALALLGLIAAWPELERWNERARMRGVKFNASEATGVLSQPRYNGVDQRGRPYTVTALQARQISATQVDLTDPVGDVQLENGRWLQAKARQGAYVQHAGSLDLSRDVEIYRDDGTTMLTDTSTIDLKNGAANSADRVHVEGPFGTLDAQGFSITNRGNQVQFWGPGHLVLNARHP
jgi:lipopolysaccharide export system protein LptC